MVETGKMNTANTHVLPLTWYRHFNKDGFVMLVVWI